MPTPWISTSHIRPPVPWTGRGALSLGRTQRACAAMLLTLGCWTALPSAQASGIPVIDASNLVQTVVSASESVAQTLKQIEQYRTQLEQYQNQLQNSLAPTAYVWDQAQRTINNLMAAVDTLNYHKQQLGSLDAYLQRFQNVAYYRNSPCFKATGCNATQRAALVEQERLGSEAQKLANDALFRGLDQQQALILSDARNLEQLQARAQASGGHMEALQYANQLASHQANQLLQIRSLLMAQQNATTTRLQAEMDREALIRAASENARAGTYRPSTSRSW